MQPIITYLLIHFLRILSWMFYRTEVKWVGELAEDPWEDLRLVAIVNHTSLYEWLFASTVPNRFIRQMAWHGVVPVAEKTLDRPLIGYFYRNVARHVVSITRKRDHTWAEVLNRVEDNAIVIMLPEGRMKRATGLDLHGRPMTMRGGIADVIQAIPTGRMLVAYSGGLHHVQHPGERFPKLFKTLRMNLEVIDIPSYRQGLLEEVGKGRFREAVKADLQRRKEQNCPPGEFVYDPAPAPSEVSTRKPPPGEER